MFDQTQQTGGYFRSVFDALAVLPRRYTAILLFAVVMLIPYPTTAVPEWKIRVVNQNGSPEPGAYVYEFWEHNYLWSGLNWEDSRTDGAGYAVFPEQKVWATPLRRIGGKVLSFLEGRHADVDVTAYVVVSGHSIVSDNYYTPGKPPPAEITVNDRPDAASNPNLFE